MKFTINGLEVEIKAKGIHGERYNKVDLGYFLTDIALWATDSAKWNEHQGYEGMANEARQVSRKIHEQMLEAGMYK